MTKLEAFFQSFQTLPQLLSELALAIAAAQARLDEDYVQNLREFLAMVAGLERSGFDVRSSMPLLSTLAPARQQFTQATLEVHADLQQASLSGHEGSAQLGLRAALFAVAWNASYARRFGVEQRASATIRAEIQALSPGPAFLERLAREAASQAPAASPETQRYQELAGLLRSLPSRRGPEPAPSRESAPAGRGNS
ncbi:MAG: hypothetical protein NZV14_06175 [Bryobacteraceae bacterium]|nr:hypothetical protein [Bryobacteraceae bacterium]MDW8377728.1 hypothetical protein [Bryobacterales bacterium]